MTVPSWKWELAVCLTRCDAFCSVVDVSFLQHARGGIPVILFFPRLWLFDGLESCLMSCLVFFPGVYVYGWEFLCC